jgi:hypothetical protein
MQKIKVRVFFPNIFIIFFCILVLVSSLFDIPRQVFPFKTILEFGVFLIFMFTCMKYKSKYHYLLLYFIGYILYNITYGYFISGAHIRDILIENKFLFYFPIIIFACSSKSLISFKTLSLFQKVIIIVFIFKYSFMKFIEGVNRPEFISESNFELSMILIVSFFIFYFSKKISYVNLSLVFLIVLLSGSRSAFLGLIPFVFLCFSRAELGKSLRYIVISFIVFAVLLLTAILAPRILSFDSIDRLTFLFILFDEVQSWTFFEFLFGTDPITPLKDASCHRLRHFEGKFASDGSGKCYAVILHSFFMRLFFNHGVIGLFVTMASLYSIIRSRFDTHFTLGIMFFVCTSSLSVSGMSNVFIVFSLCLLFISKLPEIPNYRV